MALRDRGTVGAGGGAFGFDVGAALEAGFGAGAALAGSCAAGSSSTITTRRARGALSLDPLGLPPRLLGCSSPALLPEVSTIFLNYRPSSRSVVGCSWGSRWRLCPGFPGLPSRVLGSF